MSDYATERNKLIPIAEDHADRAAGPRPTGKADLLSWSTRWNKLYFAKMDELARSAGLISS
jgi:hypothetical protein